MGSVIALLVVLLLHNFGAQNFLANWALFRGFKFGVKGAFFIRRNFGAKLLFLHFIWLLCEKLNHSRRLFKTNPHWLKDQYTVSLIYPNFRVTFEDNYTAINIYLPNQISSMYVTL